MKILITGGAGFIGSHLCERFDDVTVFDNFSSGKRSNISKDIEVIEGSINDYNKVAEAVKGKDIVIHQAFPYGMATRELDKQFVEDGAIGTYNVLRASIEHNVEKVIYASTVAVYGRQKYLPIDEGHPKNPFLPYGATKLLGEMYCSTLKNVYGLNTVSLRYFNVYGKRYPTFDHSAMIKFLKCAKNDEPLLIYGDGSQLRDYTYIDDIVEGTILALEGSGEYNIARGEGIRIIDLAKKILEVTGKDLEIKFIKQKVGKSLPYGITDIVRGRQIDTRNYIADISKAQRELGYKPTTKLEEGIRETYKWI